MMQWQRKNEPQSDVFGTKIAAKGALHGAIQGKTMTWLNANEDRCDQAREFLDGNLFADMFPGFKVE